MRGDFSRDTFDARKHFSRVLQQQGRVHLDADWNEQSAILLHYLRTLAADLIGPFAGPAGTGLGFAIGDVDEGTFAVGRGRYYVDGILCENDDPGVRYDAQAHWPTPPPLERGGDRLVYLDVWERHITAVEDDDIREKALGGPDTATRSQVVWQVKLDELPESIGTPAAVRRNWSTLVPRWQPPRAGCLRARVEQPEGSGDPCLTAPDARYRGAENQLYRIEVHRGGRAGEATFKWSRNNGAICTRVSGAGTELIAESTDGLAPGSWIELTNDAQELRGRAGTLVRLLRVDADRLTLETNVATPEDVAADEEWPTRARAWDHRQAGRTALVDGAIPISESAEETGWITVEHGIQIQFLPAAADVEPHVYRTGDYWLIPARVATGAIEWPVQDGDRTRPVPRSPHGIRHHYAPLAILRQDGEGWAVDDCRCEFAPLKNSCTPALQSLGEDGMGAWLPCAVPDGPE